MAVNRVLAQQVLDKIVAEPLKHDQTSWATVVFDDVAEEKDGWSMPVSCATQGCVAGWASMLSGDRLFVSDEEVQAKWRRSDGVVVGYEQGTELQISEVLTPNGVEEIQSRAKDLLGLTGVDASWLFEAERSRNEVIGGLQDLIDNGEISQARMDDTYDDYLDL